MTTIIAVCGIPGSGKSTAMQAVCAAMAGVRTIHAFEDYSRVSRFPRDIRAWVAEGKDPNAWEAPRLVADLDALKRGQPIVLPAGTAIAPSGVILLEDFFGRSRTAIAPFLDAVVVIEAPLEVALARRIIRDVARDRRSDEERLKHVVGFCESYLEGVRDLYAASSDSARVGCELVIDGTRPAGQVAEGLMAFMRKTHGAARG